MAESEKTQEVGDETLKSTEISNKVDKQSCMPSSRVKKNHPTYLIIGDVNEARKTRDKQRLNYCDTVMYAYYTSIIEPTNVNKALKDKCWIGAMQEVLQQFEWNEIWELVQR